MFLNLGYRLKLGYFFLFSILLLSLDQFLKYVLKTNLSQSFYLNTDQIFGLELAFPIYLLVIILLVILFWGIKAKKNIGQALIFSGGFSNLIDRLYLGGVVDFRLPGIIAFNLADLMIIAGVVLIIYLSLVD